MAEKLTIEELRGRIGQEVGMSKWIDIPQSAIDAFADLMRPLGLRELARTGVAALSRGA